MMKLAIKLFSYSLLSISMMLSANQNDNIVVFTTHQYPSDHHQVIYLDEALMLEDQFFPSLSNKPEIAHQQALTLIQSPDFKQKQIQLINAYNRLIEAYSLGLEKVPAVVFNGRDVVYGTTDVALAIKLRRNTP